jgi:hypothetical protein
VHQALIVVDLDKKEVLFSRAQEWLRLAYASGDAEFERSLTDFNAGQLGAQRLPPAMPTVQGQPKQQQRMKQDDK